MKKALPFIIIVVIILGTLGFYAYSRVDVIPTTASIYRSGAESASMLASENSNTVGALTLAECKSTADFLKVEWTYINGKCYLFKGLSNRPQNTGSVSTTMSTSPKDAPTIANDITNEKPYEITKKICDSLGGEWKWVKINGAWQKACVLLKPGSVMNGK